MTGFPNGDDPNSYFIIKSSIGSNSCLRGDIIACGSKIRLEHVSTQHFLHSHNIPAPISKFQEVSAYNSPDTGDDWKVVCTNKNVNWLREVPIRLRNLFYLSWLEFVRACRYRHVFRSICTCQV